LATWSQFTIRTGGERKLRDFGGGERGDMGRKEKNPHKMGTPP